MSLEPMIWVLSGDAPVADVNEYAVLGAMAETAGRDGCGTWQSKETLAARCHVSEETVKRCWRNMLRRGLIGKGDQGLVKHYRADRRPVVYDLLIPYTWFPNIDRTNAERARHGQEPLTPQNRPPIAPPPTRGTRSDKGVKRPRKEAPDERGNSQTPRGGDAGPSHGGTTSSPRGNYKSSTGELVDPQTRTTNPGKEEPQPPANCGPSPTESQRKAAAPSALRAPVEPQGARPDGLPFEGVADHSRAEDQLPVVGTATIPGARGDHGGREETAAQLERERQIHFQQCAYCQRGPRVCQEAADLIERWSLKPDSSRVPAPF